MKKINISEPIYIIYAPSFDINMGGIIALHRLCHLLRDMNFQSFLYPARHRAPQYGTNLINNFEKFIRYWYRVYFPRPYNTFQSFKTPVLSKIPAFKNAIVVYPETIEGNPLKMKHVVRWLLHVPGYHTGKVRFGEDDLMFFWQKSFNHPDYPAAPENHLCTPYIMKDVYRQTNFGKRTGTCYLLKKGRHRKIEDDLSGKFFIDGMAHEQVAQVFNECEYFVSYDLKTTYSLYAAICGCVSIVWPEPGLSKKEWQPDEELTYGIAYGFDDIPYALQTRKQMFEKISAIDKKARDSVLAFTTKCNDHFFTQSQDK